MRWRTRNSADATVFLRLDARKALVGSLSPSLYDLFYTLLFKDGPETTDVDINLSSMSDTESPP